MGAYLLDTLAIGPPSNLGDEPNYLGFAHSLLHGHYAEAHGFSRLEHGPGLPLALAPFVALHVPTLILRCFFGPVLLFLAVVAFFHLAATYVDRSGALAAAFLFGAYWPFAMLLRTIGSETMTILIITLLAYETSLRFRHRRRRDVLLAGILTGLLALTRVEFGYLLPVWLLLAGLSYFAGRSAAARFTLAVSAVGLALCVPYLVYTYSTFHRFYYWSDSGGAQLYWMASGKRSDLGDWQTPRVLLNNPHLASHRPFFRYLERLPPGKRDSALKSRAFHNIEKDPLLYGRNLVFNASRQVVNSPYSYTPTKLISIGFYGVPAVALLLAVLTGLVGVIRRRVDIPVEVKLFLFFSATTFVVHTLVAGEARFFTMIVPPLMLVATYTLLTLRRLQSSRVLRT